MTSEQRVATAQTFLVAADTGTAEVFSNAFTTFQDACAAARLLTEFTQRSVRVLADGHAVTWS